MYDFPERMGWICTFLYSLNCNLEEFLGRNLVAVCLFLILLGKNAVGILSELTFFFLGLDYQFVKNIHPWSGFFVMWTLQVLII